MNQYLKLLTDIKERGTRKPAARANMPGTTSLFGYQLRHNLAEGFPLLTSKKLHFDSIIIELLWFLRGDTNVKYLIDNGVNIWNEDAYNFYSKLCIQWHETPVDFKSFVEKTKTGEKHPKYKFYSFGDCGLQYGHQWINFGALPRYIVQPKRGAEIVGGSKHLLKSTWEQMIARCYNPDSIGFKNYGAKGVHVCDEWLDFGTFVNSVMTMEGWEEKEKDWSNWQLDKDFKGDGFRYSLDTCRWVNRETNMSSSTEKFTFYREEDKYKETTTNLRKFGRTHGISHSNLSRVISGERKSTGGFVLDKIESKYEGINQIKNIIKGLRENPMSRRHIISAWNPEDLDNMALHPCHALVQFNCRPIGYYERCQLGRKMGFFASFYHDEITHDDLDENGIPSYYLDCQMYQRSADVFLGVPYNIASYSLLTHIIAKMVNMIPGDYIHTFGDVHIYDNHMDQVNEQLSREPKKLPKLLLKDEFHYITDEDLVGNVGLDKIISEMRPDWFSLEGYNPHPRIKAKLSTGLK